MNQQASRPRPPRARIAFRVGVVGHRPDRLREAALPELAALVASFLAAVKQAVGAFADTADAKTFYASDPPLLRAISPLAEGTDRIFAEQAIALGYSVGVPMPFARSEYERDFDAPHALEPDSLERFRRLLNQAGSVFELDGDRAAAGEAYGAAGRIVLNQSDLLIVVWDGRAAAGLGGTVDTLTQAMDFQVPVIWIDAVAPHSWQLLRDRSDLGGLLAHNRATPSPGHTGTATTLADVVGEIVQAELALPAPAGERGADARKHAHEYFQQQQPRANLAVIWKLFRDAFATGRPAIPHVIVPDIEASARAEWPVAVQGRDDDSSSWVNGQLRSHFGWPDRLADRYADAYRSACVLAYLFSALAVWLALLPGTLGITNHHAVLWWSVLELTNVAAILGILQWADRRRWHERWMDYRLLAELIRQLRLLLPLGGGRPLPRMQAHFSVYGEPAETWMYWHVRAIARVTGLPGVAVTPDYVRHYLAYLRHTIRGSHEDGRDGQRGFHITNSLRSGRMHHRLHRLSFLLFAITFACVLVRFVPMHWMGLPEDWMSGPTEAWFTLASAAFPALGAALVGIDNQAELARIAKRSRAMADAFTRFEARIAPLQGEGAIGPVTPRATHVTPIASEMAQLMVDEVLDWRIVFTDRSRPGV